MEYKSNITLSGNIYNRRGKDVRYDPHFVKNVHGVAALQKLNLLLHGTGGARLSSIQQRELSERTACSAKYNTLNEITHGPVKTAEGIIWACRCENVDCIHFSECMPVPLARPPLPSCEPEAPETDEFFFEHLGAVEEIFCEPELPSVMMEEEEELPPPELLEVPAMRSDSFEEIASPKAIIKADLDTHILVNAEPGSGKTYTVTKRLAHIIQSGMLDVSQEQVLVLCYTTAARDLILRRLEAEGLAAEAQQLVICTFDSLAYHNLMKKTDKDLFELGYEGCIEAFNATFDKEEWANSAYVIIDELQDLVNGRARMTLNILGALQCGYLLLGDKCQAIYDYNCKRTDSVSSQRFYEALDALLPPEAKRYELMGNKRQSEELSRRSKDLRNALLSSDYKEANAHFREEITSLPKRSFSAEIFSIAENHSTTAILTRNNGEAEWVSALLCKEGVEHSLLRSTHPKPSYHRCLADVFWDYREARISRRDFIRRFQIRCGQTEDIAEGIYNALASLLPGETEYHGEYLEMDRLYRALKAEDHPPAILTNAPCSNLTVSTIHKAKGREFDHVYLLSDFSPSEESTEEARVWYVGATRPRTKFELFRKKKLYTKGSEQTERRMQTKYHFNQILCARLAVGLPEDVDPQSFIAGDLSRSLAIQQYLSSSVAINDQLELVKSGGVYVIMHKENIIGALNPAVNSDFFGVIRRVNKWSGIPSHLTEVYVRNLVTCIQDRFPVDTDSMFKDSKFWLGIEITGFAKAGWGGC